MTTCERCGRRPGTPYIKLDAALYCNGLDCATAASAYRRGLRDGVAMAKAESFIDRGHGGYGPGCACMIDWDEVDAELARRGK